MSEIFKIKVEDDLGKDVEYTQPDLSRLPQKSKTTYEAAYDKFMRWRSAKKIDSFSESIFLMYFSELATHYKPTTLWSIYSMIRSIIEFKHQLNICDYTRLIAFLKQKNKGYIKKKAQALSAEHINRFLQEAPDSKYLAVKVALIFGVQGACRRQELCDLTVNDIEEKGDMVLVRIPKTKYDISRSFVITDNFFYIYKKYAILRPKNVLTSRFFLSYRNGKCGLQVIGINNFGSMPKTVAQYLKLKEPESYTGHSFRRTSATLLADSGVDLFTINRHAESKSNTVAEDYSNYSLSNKKRMELRRTLQVKNFNSFAEIRPDNEDEEIELILRIWALRYRKLPKNQKLFVKKAIDDIFYEAELSNCSSSEDSHFSFPPDTKEVSNEFSSDPELHPFPVRLQENTFDNLTMSEPYPYPVRIKSEENFVTLPSDSKDSPVLVEIEEVSDDCSLNEEPPSDILKSKKNSMSNSLSLDATNEDLSLIIKSEECIKALPHDPGPQVIFINAVKSKNESLTRSNFSSLPPDPLSFPVKMECE